MLFLFDQNVDCKILAYMRNLLQSSITAINQITRLSEHTAMGGSTWILVAILVIHHGATEIEAASRIHNNTSNIFASRDSEADVDSILEYLDAESKGEEASKSFGDLSIPTCIRRGQGEEKVLNGVPAPSKWREWFVEINNAEQICGGARISPRLILTAAHCFFEVQAHNKKKSNDCLDGISEQASATLKPPGWAQEEIPIIRVYKDNRFCSLPESSWIYQFDVAIAIVSREFKAPFVPGFCLMGHHIPHAKDRCYAVGVGYTTKGVHAGDINRPRPQELRRAEVEKLVCKKVIKTQFTDAMRWNIACTTTGGTKGDSGGPVVCERPGYDKLYLMGVISKVRDDENATILHNTMRHVDKLWIQKFLKSKRARKYDACYEAEHKMG